jgi:predicted transcriptional regulator
MLAEIKKCLRERGAVSLNDLAARFQVEESALEKMMEMLIRKGSVKKEKIGCSCNSRACCCVKSCRSAAAVFYRWVE